MYSRHLCRRQMPRCGHAHERSKTLRRQLMGARLAMPFSAAGRNPCVTAEQQEFSGPTIRGGKVGGPDRDRTGDLVNAIQARSQLRHWPTSGVRTNLYCLPSAIKASGLVPAENQPPRIAWLTDRRASAARRLPSTGMPAPTKFIIAMSRMILNAKVITLSTLMIGNTARRCTAAP